jgi:excisionase family DNA binding protein
MKRLTVTVEEFAALMGVSRNTGYTAVHNGDVPSLRVGSRIVIPRSALEELIGPFDLPDDETPAEAGAPPEPVTLDEDERSTHV